MIRTLVVDDSAVVRKIIGRMLSKDPAIEVVGTAHDAFSARDMAVALNPDVMTLDVEMPGMDGITFLEKLMKYMPIPTLVVSSVTPTGGQEYFRALEAGAVDVVPKPQPGVGLEQMAAALVTRVKMAATAHVAARPRPTAVRPLVPVGPFRTQQVIVVGASTGGTSALEHIFSQLPASTPGTVVVQHMPAFFTKEFARRLDRVSPMRVKEADDGDWIEPGTAVLARGGVHLRIEQVAGRYRVRFDDSPPVCFCRPAVDVLFESAAASSGPHTLAVILTGMGRDGTAGMQSLKQVGAVTFAQDEATSVVFGMPASAIRAGVVDHVLPLEDIAPALLKASTMARLTKAP